MSFFFGPDKRAFRDYCFYFFGLLKQIQEKLFEHPQEKMWCVRVAMNQADMQKLTMRSKQCLPCGSDRNSSVSHSDLFQGKKSLSRRSMPFPGKTFLSATRHYVVYDNACVLARYVRHRAPSHLADLTHVLDVPHSEPHGVPEAGKSPQYARGRGGERIMLHSTEDPAGAKIKKQ